MNQAGCRFKYVVSRLFRVSILGVSVLTASLLGLSPHSLGQLALPPLHPVNVLNFTIPFEVSESASSLGDVELLVSHDRGRRWHSFARQPVESGKFAFRADGDGEYWFAFRRVSTTGSLAPFSGQPHLRVLVNTHEAIIVPPSSSTDSGPITPPRPERFRPESRTRPQPQPMQLNRTGQSETEPAEKNTSEAYTNESATSEVATGESESDALLLLPERNIAGQPRPVFGPRLPGFDPSAAARNYEGALLEDVLSGMSTFMDVQPVTVRRAVPNNPVPANVTPAVGINTAPSAGQPSIDMPAGMITGVDLHSTASRPRPHVIVQWHTGNEFSRDAQIDVLRSSTKEGPWVPVAINLQNSGEYWWFLTPEDLKPFFIAVRTRSLHGGIQMNVTQTAIEIDSKMAQFQR